MASVTKSDETGRVIAKNTKSILVTDDMGGKNDGMISECFDGSA